MAVATAIVGGAAISAVASNQASRRASSAATAGAQSAADATVEATRLQVNELRRQFDAQMELLGPLIQNQYGANSAFAQLLGFNDFDPETGTFSNGFSFGGTGPGGFQDPNLNSLRLGGETSADTEFGQNVLNNRLSGQTLDDDVAIRRARETGLFDGINQDSMVEQARARQNAGTTIEGDYSVRNVLDNQAAGDVGTDLAIRRASDNVLAAPSLDQDARFRHAVDTAVVGEDFRTSPGYAFSVEEAMREVDRRNSRGGANFGGRALLEATRRAQGEADQEYYNWVSARQGDLARQDSAAAAYDSQRAVDIGRGDTAVSNYLARESFDLSRLDAATQDYLRRLGIDINREDAAVGDARRREELDVARGDAALDDYLRRLGIDTQRGDQAVLNNQQLNEFDLRRQDQAYYNYLAQIAAAGGIGANNVGQAVGASGATGAGIANAYGQQGGQLANIYNSLGITNANIAAGEYAGYNNAIQGGIQNYLFADMAGLL